MTVSRRALIVFASVMALITGELLWWVYFHVRTSDMARAEHMKLLESQRLLAGSMIVMWARSSGEVPPEMPASLLAQEFRELQWRPGAFEMPDLNALYPGYGVFVKQEVLDDMQSRHHAHVRMFVSEGGFFLLAVLFGGWLIVRTLQREVALMRQQANFLSAVTHELKSPLASIRLYTETMQLRDPPLDTRKRYLGIMRGDVDRLETLVANLLAVARLEAGQFVVHAERVDVREAVRAAVQGMGQNLTERGCLVQLGDLPSDSLVVYLDAGALQTVLRNLLDNAAKYGGGKPVQIHVRGQARQAQIVVQDQGIGLAEVEVSKIFQKFYRVGDEMVRQAEGSGLGLYLVNALIQQSGGTVTVQSAGLGQGTTFTVTLPLAAAEG